MYVGLVMQLWSAALRGPYLEDAQLGGTEGVPGLQDLQLHLQGLTL